MRGRDPDLASSHEAGLQLAAVTTPRLTLDVNLLAPAGRIQGPVDGLLLRVLKEERDLTVLRLWLAMALIYVPTGVLLFAWGDPPLWAHAAYLVLTFYFAIPHILAMHVAGHRGIFKPRYRWMYDAVVWFIGPFAGQSPETYRVHHMGMHHREENLEGDLSSTMLYQRDRLCHFVHYVLRFLIFGLVDLGRYHHKRGHRKMLQRMAAGEAYYVVVVGTALWFNPPVALTVFILPLLAARIGMMCGNWAQHAFVDAEDPASPYKSSITCIDNGYNRRCFNDGFHIGHHVRPNRHWSEMPTDFLDNLDVYSREGAVVFRGLDYFWVWLFLMLRWHRKLAEHLVDLPGQNQSLEEKVELLRSRLRPIHRENAALSLDADGVRA